MSDNSDCENPIPFSGNQDIKPEITKPAVPSTTIVRTVIWNPAQDSGASPRYDPADKVVQLHSSSVSSNQQTRKEPEIIAFTRLELDQILRVYGFKVADGEWKDYSIDMLKDRAVFSVYRRAHDAPLHCIEKVPKLARKQGAFSVTGADGRILKRGHDLATVLKLLEKRPKLRVI